MFVVLEDCAHGTFEVLAKAASIWAGEALMNLFAGSLLKRPELKLVK